MTDSNGSQMNIIGNTAVLDAATGIGHGDALETQLTTLAARVRSSSANGNIEISNDGDLLLNDIAGWGY